MKLWHAIVAVLREILSDRNLASIFIAASVLYSFFYPSAYSNQISAMLPVAIVDLDQSALSRRIIRDAMAVRAIRLTRVYASMPEARAAMNQRQIDGFLLIPADFERNALGGRQGTLALYGNGGFLVRNSAVLSAFGEIAAATGEEIAARSLMKAGIAAPLAAAVAVPVRLVTRPLYNTREGYGSYAVPAVAQLIVQQVLLFGICMLIGLRREQGLLTLGKRNAETEIEIGGREPGLSALDFWGLFFAFFIVGCLNAYYFNGMAFWYQDYPRAGNVLGMVLLTPLFVAAVVAMSLWLAGFFDNGGRCMQMLLFSSLIFFFAAGVSWPISSIPEPLLWLSRLVPSTVGIGAYVKLNQMGASLSEIRLDLLVLTVLFAVYFTLAWRKLVRRG